jgi:hypothetical protein
MGKYAPLKAFLMEQGKDHVAMTFAEIETVLGLPLPPSKQYPAWWSNNPSNNTMTREWLDAGYQTESVDIAGEKLVFRRMVHPNASASTIPHGDLQEGTVAFPRAGHHPGFGFMKGLLTIEEGYDITKPFSDEVWDAGYLGFEEKK